MDAQGDKRQVALFASGKNGVISEEAGGNLFGLIWMEAYGQDLDAP